MWFTLLTMLAGADSDPKDAEAAFARMEHALKCKTLQVQVEINGELDKEATMSVKGRLVVGEGDKVRLELDGEAKGNPKRILLVSDGKKLRYENTNIPTQNLDPKRQLGMAYRGSLSRAGIYYAAFAQEAPGQEDECDPEKVFPISDIKLGKKEVISGREAQAIEYKLMPLAYKEPFEVTVWVDVKTNFPVKRVVTHTRGDNVWTVTESYAKGTLDEKIDEKEFELPK
jgi:outer membrane lipoprotein-sorting protein